MVKFTLKALAVLLQNIAFTTNIVYPHYTYYYVHFHNSHHYIGAVTSDGLTPLGLAFRRGNLDTIKYLITEYNVDINGKLVIP